MLFNIRFNQQEKLYVMLAINKWTVKHQIFTTFGLHDACGHDTLLFVFNVAREARGNLQLLISLLLVGNMS